MKIASAARIGLSLAAGIIANAIGVKVLERNLKAGYYSPNADTIMIPMVENFVVSTALVLLLIVSVLCSWGGTSLKALSALFSLVAAVLSAFVAFSWAVPEHYPMAVGFGLLTIISIEIMWSSSRRVASAIAQKLPHRIRRHFTKD